MITILITAFREPDTVGKAIESFLPQLPQDVELLVVSPDPATTAVVETYARRYPVVRHIQDPQSGKPAALNFGLRAARGDIVIFSDGDVVVDTESLIPLVTPFENSQVGAVSGRPVSISPRDTLLGYWSQLLVESAHQVRAARDGKGEFLLCSGYLFAARRNLLGHIPEDALAEDAVISHQIAQAGYRIRYAPQARVAVKYPTTYDDWLRQKVRSAGGYAQDYVRQSPFRMRSLQREIIDGTRLALAFPENAREFAWTVLLFAARLHLWALVFVKVRLFRRPLSALWQRVESTK
ncbi:MAG: glycosyltransferase [Anaerolineae bacterium]|nr:glycosyltransferase [Anaerolineae bacterium]